MEARKYLSLIGRKGGSVRSKAKAEAARKNAQLGGPHLTRRKCRQCKTNRLASTNRSGLCRSCQGHPA